MTIVFKMQKNENWYKLNGNKPFNIMLWAFLVKVVVFGPNSRQNRVCV